MRTKPLSSPRLLKKRRKRIVLKSIGVAFSVAAVLVLPVILFHLSFWQVNTILVSNNVVVPEDTIVNVAQSDMIGSYAFMFPKTNILLYPKTTIEKDIIARFPRIMSTSVSMKSLTSISISVVERKPKALWCQNSKASSSDCYFLDEHGFVFDHAPEFTDNVYVIYSGNIEGDPLTKTYGDTDEFSNIENFLVSMRSLSLAPISVSNILDNDYDVSLKSGEHILFSTKESLDQTISNLKSVLSDPKLNLKQSGNLVVSSIDLRFGNKVFYKQKGK